MTVIDESIPEVSLPLAGPSMIDGQPTRGPLIIVRQDAEVAIWQVDLAGNPCGAWVLPGEGADAALRLLAICDRRSLITVDSEQTVDLILEWAKESNITIDRYTLEARLCPISSLVEETRAARAKYVDALQLLQIQRGKKLAPLVWKRLIPEPAPQTLNEWAEVSVLPRMDVVHSTSQEAQCVAALVRYALGLWQDTELRRSRRKYLREDFGPSQPLPASWREAVVSAYQSPLDLPRSGSRGDHPPG